MKVRVVVRNYKFGMLASTTDVIATPALVGTAPKEPRRLDETAEWVTVVDLIEVDDE